MFIVIIIIIIIIIFIHFIIKLSLLISIEKKNSSKLSFSARHEPNSRKNTCNLYGLSVEGVCYKTDALTVKLRVCKINNDANELYIYTDVDYLR